VTRTAAPVDPWHYPRPELAAKYLEVFDLGLTSARALFAKRRMGKSEFLEQDLIPAAQTRGYITVYLNLWDARKPTHSDLTHSLRASLDGRKQNIKVVFAGSSEATLRRMFGRSTEPFYNWTPLEPFELLGEDFVRAMVMKVNGLTKYALTLKHALTAFEALKRTPEFFRRYLNRYLTHADLGAMAALDDTKLHVFNDANFVNVWNDLLPADREVLRLIMGGITDVFSESSRLGLGQALGLDQAVTKNVPQQSLRRLQEMELVLRIDYGKYQLQDDAFAEWLRTHDLEA
jgi:hypothetical protein